MSTNPLDTLCDRTWNTCQKLPSALQNACQTDATYVCKMAMKQADSSCRAAIDYAEIKLDDAMPNIERKCEKLLVDMNPYLKSLASAVDEACNCQKGSTSLARITQDWTKFCSSQLLQIENSTKQAINAADVCSRVEREFAKDYSPARSPT